jgi:hypothetical protein
MSFDELDFRLQVLLSFQRALWDMVTPSLRGVAVKLVLPVIEARFIYDGTSADDLSIPSEVETYVVADFRPPIDVRFSAFEVPLGDPRDLLAGEEWVYLRREQS